MKTMLFALTVCLSLSIQAQYSYEPSEEYPFGRPHPNSPSQLLDYAPLIGECDCQSTKRNPDGSWAAEEQMTWRFKYIMNGTAIQDETLKENGSHSGSIRQFIADSSKWYVHYYSNSGPSTILPAWEGKKRGDSIVLYRDQKAPNGMDGSFRLSFKNISEAGFDWIGEWVDKTEQIVYPTWKIFCRKKGL